MRGLSSAAWLLLRRRSKGRRRGRRGISQLVTSEKSSSSNFASVPSVETSRNLFRVLGVAPQIGPSFSGDSGLNVNGNLEAVISDRLWRSRFNGDRSIIGKFNGMDGPEFDAALRGCAVRGPWSAELLGSRKAP